MLQPFALALAVVVAQAAPAPASFDAFGKVLSDQQRSQIARDSRCGDAQKTTDQFVSTKDPKTGVKAMVGLEQCASLARVGDWSDYRNYLITAAAAVAYEVGVIANEPKAFDRALNDLSHVDGYQAPQSTTMVVVGNRNTTQTAGQGSAGSMNENYGQQSMEAGLPMQNSASKEHQSVHASGYSGTYGELATQLGEAAQAQLSQRAAKSQSAH